MLLSFSPAVFICFFILTHCSHLPLLALETAVIILTIVPPSTHSRPASCCHSMGLDKALITDEQVPQPHWPYLLPLFL